MYALPTVPTQLIENKYFPDGLKTAEGGALIDLLYDAIPEKFVEETLAKFWHPYISKAHIIASYNDSRATDQEVIDWYERALVGIKATPILA